MTFHIKKLGVKIGIHCMEGLIACKKALAIFFFIIRAPIKWIGIFLWSFGGRQLALLAVRLVHVLHLQKTFVTRPLVVLFGFFFIIALTYQVLRPHQVLTQERTQNPDDIVEQADIYSNDMGPEAPLQALLPLPSSPIDEANDEPTPTITGGNALLAPSINTTRLENRLREGPEEYIVESGDTISDLADRFGISIATILYENKLTARSLLREGMTLTILPVSGISYAVRRGDTLGTIAKKFNVDERNILEFNEIADASFISPEQKIIVPEAEPPQPTPSIRPPQTPRPSIGLPSLANEKFIVPTLYRRISQWFTYRHSGIDMAGVSGTPIAASANGTVIQSGWGRGYGYYVLIDHGSGLMTRYAHASKLLVQKGQSVSRGENIALMGSTGRSTGPHLHFETIVNGRFVNPTRYIKL